MQASHTTAVPPPPLASSGRLVRPRHLQWAGFIAGLAWYFCARALAASAASGIAFRFALDAPQRLLRSIFELFLIVVGIGLLAGIERRRAPLRLTLGLPLRSTAWNEWAEGAAVGWGLAIACVLPMLLAGTLDVRLWTSARAWILVLLNGITLAILALCVALGIFGYAFQRLVEATGPARATTLLALMAAIYTGLNPDAGGPPGLRILVVFLGTCFLCICWLRTHGLWLLWGVYFAWTAALGVIFGLPVDGSGSFASVVETRALGSYWLTGGDYGPAAALFTILFLLGAIALVLRLTSEYAWSYTHPPIIPGGYAVEVPPPAAHTEVESAAPPPPQLIQILPTTPQPVPPPPRD